MKCPSLMIFVCVKYANIYSIFFDIFQIMNNQTYSR